MNGKNDSQSHMPTPDAPQQGDSKNTLPSGRIAEVERSLQSREGPRFSEEHTPLSRREVMTVEGWQHESEDASIPVTKQPVSKHALMKTFFIASLIFFFVAAGFSAIVFYRQANVVSVENLNMIIGAPLAVAGGEEVSFEVTIENGNTDDIESANLLMTFPDGTRAIEDLSVDIPRIRETIGDIPAGERVSKTIKVAFFGVEKEVKKIVFELNYRLKGSNAVFSKKKDVSLELATSPITLSVDVLKQLSANQLFELTATVASNAKSTVQGVLLEAQYPFGFTFVSSDPATANSTNDLWQLGDIAPGERRTIRIRGRLTGQNDDARAFRFVVGDRDRFDQKKMETVFVTHVEELAIQKPFISLDLQFDGSAAEQEYSFPGGRSVQGFVKWKNNLSTRVADAVIEVRIKGGALDRPTIRASKGFYRSIDDTIVFDRATDNTFALLNPGDEGVVGFSFSFVPPTKAADLFLQNQELTFEVSVRGRRMSGETAIESLQNGIIKRVKVSSDINISSRSSYSGGFITNWGPIPPRAEQPTRYTATWSITNTFNAVDNVQVISPTLPTYVRWTGVTYPPSEDIKLLDNGSIVWDVGEVGPYTGFVTPPREVHFQIEILPSITQIGLSPLLVQPAELNGRDLFTGVRLYATGNGMSTVISTDPIYNKGDELVAP